MNKLVIGIAIMLNSLFSYAGSGSDGPNGGDIVFLKETYEIALMRKKINEIIPDVVEELHEMNHPKIPKGFFEKDFSQVKVMPTSTTLYNKNGAEVAFNNIPSDNMIVFNVTEYENRYHGKEMLYVKPVIAHELLGLVEIEVEHYEVSIDYHEYLIKKNGGITQGDSVQEIRSYSSGSLKAVKITQAPKDHFRFQYCNNVRIPDSCHYLGSGPEVFYTKQLIEDHMQKYLEIAKEHRDSNDRNWTMIGSAFGIGAASCVASLTLNFKYDHLAKFFGCTAALISAVAALGPYGSRAGPDIINEALRAEYKARTLRETLENRNIYRMQKDFYRGSAKDFAEAVHRLLVEIDSLR